MKEAVRGMLKDFEIVLTEQLKHITEAINLKFESMKKVVGDYLELTSNISLASVKTALKNI